MFFNARYYQKGVGRFTSCDAIKSVSSNLVINPYVYCGNNPISFSDPTGLQQKPKGTGPSLDAPRGGGPTGAGFNGWEHGFDRAQYAEGQNTAPWSRAERWNRAEHDEANYQIIKAAYESAFNQAQFIAECEAESDAFQAQLRQERFENTLNFLLTLPVYDFILVACDTGGLERPLAAIINEIKASGASVYVIDPSSWTNLGGTFDKMIAEGIYGATMLFYGHGYDGKRKKNDAIKGGILIENKAMKYEYRNSFISAFPLSNEYGLIAVICCFADQGPLSTLVSEQGFDYFSDSTTKRTTKMQNGYLNTSTGHVPTIILRNLIWEH